jgi:hypothetical protein
VEEDRLKNEDVSMEITPVSNRNIISLIILKIQINKNGLFEK